MAKFNIVSQFLKDISFESPNVPELFFKQDGNHAAKSEINIDIQIKGAGNNLFMVELINKVHVKIDEVDKTVFLIESTFAGIVHLEDEKDEEDTKRTLLIDIPAILFRSVCGLVTHLTLESGFPVLQMPPVDFAKMYEEKQQQAKE